MKKLAILALLLKSTSAFALPLTPMSSKENTAPAFMTEAYDFEGIVQLSNCSGSLIRFDSSKPTDKAVVMTNGHCVQAAGGMIAPNTFLHNQPVNRQFSILSRDGQSRIGTVTSTKIMYATMTGTDLALYELNETYAQINSKYSVEPLTLSSGRPAQGQGIEIISGYWRRGYQCGLDGFVYELREAGYIWTDSIRYEVNGGCKTIHGTSGSPIIADGTRVAIGVNNTGSDDGERCTMNNPCEVDEQGAVLAEKGRSYGQQTHHVYSCLNLSNQIDLQVEGCKLFKK
jgi:V8-like Glu-specific endopeptidase